MCCLQACLAESETRSTRRDACREEPKKMTGSSMFFLGELRDRADRIPGRTTASRAPSSRTICVRWPA
eukprot:14271139-Heterocapsa_arctica.AAC.1